MSHRIRWLVAIAVGLVTAATHAAPVPAPEPGKYEPPTATFHTLPGGKVLADVKAYVKVFAGAKAVDQFDTVWDGVFGKNAKPALDLARPVAGYLYLRENLLETNGVLVIPTSNEKDALAVLEKLGLHSQVEPGANRYKLLPPRNGFPLPLYAQFADGGKLLYLAVNAKPAILDKDKLIPVAKLVDPKAKAHVTVTGSPALVPNAVRQMIFDGIDSTLMADLDRLEQRRPRDMPASFPTFMKETLRLGKRTLGATFTEGASFKLGGNLNAKNGNLELDLAVVPRAGSTFEKDIAAIKAPVGRFHQLVTKDAVLGGWGMLPTPVPKPLRDNGGAFFREWAAIFKKEAGKELGDVFDAVGALAHKAITSGKADAGFALVGPNKAGLYTGTAAVATDDSTAVEKAVRAAAKTLPDEVARRFKFDAMKINGVPVHTVGVGELADPEVQKAIGKDAKLLLAFGKDAVYAAVGPDAEAELKRAMGLTAKPGTAFDIVLHGARGVKLLTPDRFNQPVIDLGSRLNDFVSYFAVDVTGGKELRVNMKTGMVLMYFMAFSVVREEFRAVPGNVVPPPPPPPPPLPVKKK